MSSNTNKHSSKVIRQIIQATIQSYETFYHDWIACNFFFYILGGDKMQKFGKHCSSSAEDCYRRWDECVGVTGEIAALLVKDSDPPTG